MIKAFYALPSGNLKDTKIASSSDLSNNLVWVDIIQPNDSEKAWVEQAYQLELPTLQDLEDISASARFYREDDGSLHISTYFLSKNRYDKEKDPEALGNEILAQAHTVAFILNKDRLITLREKKLVSFRAFRGRAYRNDYDIDYKDPVWVLLGLLEAKLDELADILEDVHKLLDVSTTELLNHHHRELVLDLDDMVTRLAQQDDILGKAQLSLMDIRRLLVFLTRPRALGSHEYDADVRELGEDVRSLVEHNNFLFQKVRFLMDTTTGFITSEQSDIFKRYSIMTSMLAPPMLISSIYGMNIDVLPFAKQGVSGFIILSTVLLIVFILPVLYFRKRGWL